MQRLRKQVLAPWEIALRSLVFPSWGDWILGHRVAALIELSGYALGWFTIIETLRDAIQVGSNQAMQHAMIQTTIILAFAHGLDALLNLLRGKQRATPENTTDQAIVSFLVLRVVSRLDSHLCRIGISRKIAVV